MVLNFLLCIITLLTIASAAASPEAASFLDGKVTVAAILEGTVIKYTMTGTTKRPGWVAIGAKINADSKMSKADTMACLVDNLDKVTVQDGTNTGFDNTKDTTQDLNLISGSYADGKLTCVFTRKATTDDSNDVKFTDETIDAVVAVGPILDEGKLDVHTDRGVAKFNFISGIGSSVKPDTVSKYLPVIILYSWLFTLPLLGFLFQRLTTNSAGSWFIRQKLILNTTPGEWLAVLYYIVVNVVVIVYDRTTLAIAFGKLTVLNMACALIPVTRNSIWTFFFGISFERAIKFHRVVAPLTSLYAIIHLILIVKLYDSSIITSIDWIGQAVPLYGLLSLITMIIMVIFAWDVVRRKKFELFWYLHNLFFVVVALAMLHTTLNVIMLAFPFALVLLDLTLRLTSGCTRSCVIESADAMSDECTKLSVTIPKNFTFEAGQFCFLRIPTISIFEVHPFSISCAPSSLCNSNKITFHIKNMGKGQFTGKLHELAKNNELINGSAINVMGPYGSVALPKLENFKVVVLFAGGVGITPMASIFSDLKNRSGNKWVKVVLVWSTRGSEALSSWFPTMSCPPNGPVFETQYYDTSKKGTSGQELGGESTVLAGRPNTLKIIQSLQGVCSASDVAVFACGPAAMVQDVEGVCQAQRYFFHKEVFLL